MKSIILVLLMSVLSFSALGQSIGSKAKDFHNNNSCPMKSKEVSVCAVVMCDFGLLFGEWDSECTRHKIKLIKWAANPFSKLPSCKSRDPDCNITGKAQKVNLEQADCAELKTEQERNNCNLALNPDIDWSKVEPYEGDLKDPRPEL